MVGAKPVIQDIGSKPGTQARQMAHGGGAAGLKLTLGSGHLPLLVGASTPSPETRCLPSSLTPAGRGEEGGAA